VIELRTLPPKMVQVLAPFAPLFSKRVWQHARLLLVGAILAPGRRTVGSALRAMGLDQYKRFHRYHRVLSRARWSSLQASRILLGLLLEAFVVGEGPLIVGIDETLERRYGKRIAAKGVYRDPVRSTHENFVKSSGLRWVCAMLLVEMPWASRVWALPFLSALAPSERYAAKRGRRHKKITEWAWQLLLVLRRWHPKREMVATADRAYASLKLLDRCRKLTDPITFVTRLRLDAALYEPAPPRRPHQIGRPRIKGERLPNLSAVAEDPRTVWESTEIANWYGELVRQRGSHGRDRLRDGRVVLHGFARRAHPLGFDPRSGRGVQTPGPPVHRPPSRSGADSTLVRDALAVGGELPGGEEAPGIRDAEAMVGVSDPKNHTGAFGVILAGHFVRRSPDETGGGSLAPSGGLVPQEASHLRRCARVGSKGAVGSGGADFLRVARTDRHDKSPKGICGTANRGGLLRGVNG
jgi:DDE superfamily endonuclease